MTQSLTTTSLINNGLVFVLSYCLRLIICALRYQSLRGHLIIHFILTSLFTLKLTLLLDDILDVRANNSHRNLCIIINPAGVGAATDCRKLLDSRVHSSLVVAWATRECATPG